ncbi:MAG: hypothetical protein KAS15_05445 [Nanoarchaeota archaeon]|nr:hypothetical protein [Nanoarchaeota archaeon]
MTLAEMMVERRVKYLTKLMHEVRAILSIDPKENLKRLMNTKNNDVFEGFLESSRKDDYILRMYKSVKDKPFAWESFEGIEDIAAASENRVYGLLASFNQITEIVDRSYNNFKESLSSFPYFYTRDDISPNCLGANQIITSLFSIDHNVNDLRFLEVYDTKRRDTLLDLLNNIDDFRIENFGYEDWILIPKTDCFEGAFRKEDFQNMLMDTILSLEEENHGAVMEKETGKIFDYPIEKENYKSIIDHPIHEGMINFSLCNLFTLMNALDMPVNNYEEYFTGDFECPQRYMVGFMLNFYNEKGQKDFEKIKEFFGDRLPAKYLAIEALQARFTGNKGTLDYNKNVIKERYNHPKALEIIDNRYLKMPFFSEK